MNIPPPLPKAKTYKEENFFYLEAAGTKVGFNLNAGASIGYLSHDRFKSNMVNIHDKGRCIQQSYYAGQNVKRIKEGQNEVWSPWPWNPIQGGDCFRNESRVEAYLFDKKTQSAYVKCVPMQWDMKNKAADATMEQWTTILENGVMRVRNKFTVGNIPDIYAPFDTFKHQELPALYFLGHFNQFKTYQGKSPWKNEKIETRAPFYLNQSGKGWDKIHATEKWGAFVNSKDFGVGVFCPDMDKFPVKSEHNMLSGLAGKRGSKDEKSAYDSYTSYISPLGGSALKPSSIVQYEYFIIIGKTDEIRRKVYELNPGSHLSDEQTLK